MPSGAYFTVDGPNIVRAYKGSRSQEVVYSYGHLQSDGNRWMQALDKRDVVTRRITTREHDLFYDDQSGNLIVAMGLQGVVVVTPDGTPIEVAVGRYSPTDFSLGSKVGTFFSSLLHRETMVYTGLAFLLAFSFSTLALALVQRHQRGQGSTSLSPRQISAILAILAGVYPHVSEYPGEGDSGRHLVGSFVLLFSGFGLLPFLLAVGGLVLARTTLRQALAVAAASMGMLLLIVLGALVLFEAGAGIANFVAVGVVGFATLCLWAWQKHRSRRVAGA